jgi:hypothetical protein
MQLRMFGQCSERVRIVYVGTDVRVENDVRDGSALRMRQRERGE